MKKIYSLLILVSVVLFSCSKNHDAKPNGSTFEATIDGQKITFNVLSATLLRSTSLNEKRLDIYGRSADSTKELTLTLGEETSQGNGVTQKKYILNPFPDDDPNTTIDESLYTDGFTTYTLYINNLWITDVYDEKGSFVVTSCDANNTTISGTFETTLTGLNTGTANVRITDGKINNIKYTVVN